MKQRDKCGAFKKTVFFHVIYVYQNLRANTLNRADILCVCVVCVAVCICVIFSLEKCTKKS